jgi:hypothetical protein
MTTKPSLKNTPQHWEESIIAKVAKWLPQNENARGVRSPHLWIIIILMAFCTFLYYLDQTPLVGIPLFNNSFFTQIHDILRILFLILLWYLESEGV